MKRHDCAWCRFEDWLFQDFTNVILVIALTICGIFVLSALFMMMMMMIVLFAN